MKRLLPVLFFLLLFPFLNADAQTPHEVRKQLVAALKSSKTTDSLYTKLDAVKEKSGLTIGYIATLQALKAVHTWNPYFKIKYLNNAESSYKKAVAMDVHNIEIRFMRFSVEHNVPGFLGYNKNLTDDRETIIHQLKKKNYGSADHELVQAIIKFLLESKRCTPAENEYLTQQLAPPK
ncbi:hypothetical protein GCM10023149_28230 [Mucilaginibacter gynuensis]|uniref:Uncharacterized protein n=1 Tax=Mucilaginibacter gynuensis TaxID=1302236 RepID=A0ABP8GKK9_9SPHI